jgi:hypothetical protein
VTGDAFEVVAERAAPVLSDGTTLWRLERADQPVDVSSCECFEDEKSPSCKDTWKVDRPGLVAKPLLEGAAAVVYPASTDGIVGNSLDLSVSLAGGVGSKVFVRWTEGGYFCGAHGSWDGGTFVYDLAGGRRLENVLGPLGERLPASVRSAAVKELHGPLQECEGEEISVEDAAKQMSLDGLRVAVGQDGEPTVVWSFSAPVVYACSADYGVHADAKSGLLPEASELGLAGTLPKGLTKAMAQHARGKIVGWSRLSLSGDARAKALAAFQAAPEPAWPNDIIEEPKQQKAAASATDAIDEARKLTKNKDYSGAIAKFGEAIATDAEAASAWSGRGYAELLAGDYAAARADFEKALTLKGDPTYQAQVWFNLGQVAEKTNDKDAARAAYQKSLDLRPNERVKQALAALE